jgi:hypothetical protein
MKFIKQALIANVLLLANSSGFAQSLEDLLNKETSNEPAIVTATFKSTHLIHGHTIEAPAKGVLQSTFSHRFGTLEDPVYTFLGMNQASIRFGFDYGISDRFSVGIGRSSGLGGTTPPPTYDAYVKYRLISQSTGDHNVPVSVSALLATAVDTEQWPNDGSVYTGKDRMAYTAQMLVARKFGDRLSLQLMPTFLQRNLVTESDQKKGIASLGIGGRWKVSKRTAFTFEYYASQPGSLGKGYYNPIAVGYDIDTGGHIFQIMLTNSLGLIESQFLGRTATNFFSGPSGMRIGFTFSRVFTLKKK